MEKNANDNSTCDKNNMGCNQSKNDKSKTDDVNNKTPVKTTDDKSGPSSGPYQPILKTDEQLAEDRRQKNRELQQTINVSRRYAEKEHGDDDYDNGKQG
ncbi:hypothetical protein VP1G_11455 [Cytospora mali]|uniref:Uncharacterized protein n=1 Tax=Cytospora mali TaxID=578113 RepID=A0A194VFM5_CYTMA|nr:hypothetical protein VP1G_11455 [Valsa mali var. pyri (nom. inval.)]